MSKDTVSDWSTTAASNTDVGGVDLAENSMRPRDVNNAIRTMMAQIATGIDNSEFGGVPQFTPASASGPASLAFAEDTDNGTNKVTLIAPASIASDKTATFQDITGTLYITGGQDVSLADGGTGASLTDPNADRIMFWDDSAGAVTWLVPSTGIAITTTNLSLSHLGLEALTDPNADRVAFWDDSAGAFAWLTMGTNLTITGTTLDAAGGGGLTIDSQQPTSDVTTVVSTGFSGCKVVDVSFAFTHNNASAANYTLQARVSGGTFRTIATITSLADATSSFAGVLSIANFNQATEKLVSINGWTSTIVLDDSSAQNLILTPMSNFPQMAFMAFNEVWDEIQITSSVANSIEGSTADQRGRWYVAGQA